MAKRAMSACSAAGDGASIGSLAACSVVRSRPASLDVLRNTPGRAMTKCTARRTASAEPGYYDTHPDAKKKLDLARAAYEEIAQHLALLPADARLPFEALLANNNPRSTSQCVEFLRTIAPAARTHYVSRGVGMAGKHPFTEATFSIWAPEEDTSDYYSSMAPMALVNAPREPTIGQGLGSTR